MAYTASNLNVLAYANTFTLWHYVSEEDNGHTIASEGYFNDAIDMLRTNDLILTVPIGGGVEWITVTTILDQIAKTTLKK